MAEEPEVLTAEHTAVVAKLYSLAVLDEVRSAVGRLHADLDTIKRKYERELTAGPDQFRYLLAMAEQVGRDAGSNPGGGQ